MSQVTIYHNPRCSKSRQTLELIEARGIKPKVIPYLDEPPSRATLKDLLARLNLRPGQLLRSKESVCAELGLDPTTSSDEDIISAMAEHPILIERPIVVVGNRAVLGRPPENVLELL